MAVVAVAVPASQEPSLALKACSSNIGLLSQAKRDHVALVREPAVSLEELKVGGTRVHRSNNRPTTESERIRVYHCPI